MAKNIVLCSDGTGNAGGQGNGTNVWRIFTSTDTQGYKTGQVPQQIAFHDDGVGTSRGRLLKLLGGAFGFGLSRNVRRLYLRLVKNFEPGDHVYLFGFSRGAFTVRTLAAMIVNCGIVDKSPYNSDAELRDRVDEAYRVYRGNERAVLERAWRFVTGLFGAKRMSVDEFREAYALQCPRELYEDLPDGEVGYNFPETEERRHAPVRFLGVWDTVDAVGFPIREIADFWNTVVYRFKFPDVKLSPWISVARHALAIDDERHTFHPLLFDEQDPEDERRIEQLWFPGMHSNVGGGYPKQGLAHVSLAWMLTEAHKSGLHFDPTRKQLFFEGKNEQDRLYDSRSGLAIYYRYAPRDLDALCGECGVTPKVHISTYFRILRHTEDYAPLSIPDTAEIIPEDSTYPHQDPASLSALRSMMQRHTQMHRRPIDIHRSLIAMRRRLHAFFVVVTVAVIAAGLYFKQDQTGKEADLGTLLSTIKSLVAFIPGGGTLFDWVLQPLLLHPVVTPLIVVPIALYMIDSFLKKQLDTHCSEYWRRAIPGPW